MGDFALTERQRERTSAPPECWIRLQHLTFHYVKFCEIIVRR